MAEIVLGQFTWLQPPSQIGAPKKAKVFIFTSRPFQPKAGLPRGGGVKKTLPVKQQVGFEPATFWAAVKCFNHLAIGGRSISHM